MAFLGSAPVLGQWPPSLNSGILEAALLVAMLPVVLHWSRAQH